MIKFHVKALYAYKFISQCLPIYAFYTILFTERGRTVAEIGVLIALWSAFTIVFEIPSGVLADRWNRRNMLIASTVLQGVCYVIWFFSHTFLMFAIGFVFWAVAGAFTSGTEEGLIYDNLKSDGCEGHFSKIYGKARLYANIGSVVGIVSAGLLAGFIRVEWMALISAATCFASIPIILQIREKNLYSEHLTRNRASVFETFKEAGSLIEGSRIALASIVFLALFASMGDYLDEFDALIANDLQLDKRWVSAILTTRFVFIAMGGILAPLVQKTICSLKRIFLLNVLAGMILLFFAVLWNRFAILIFGFSCMVMAIAEILLVDTLQSEIREEGRATVMSVCGVGQNMAMVCFSLVYAQLAGLFSLQHVYILLSVYGIAGGLAFYLLLRRYGA